ncbi:MAG: hypothetical protein JW757_03215 [Anaerolineales bacterium]|nr:hypothetical protein [Anaerolineales bacterium]
MVPHWYALRSKPHKEFLLYEQLLAREVECFFPRLKVNPVNPRSKKVRPYFPGYLFVSADLEETGSNTFKWMPYAQHLVCFDGIPAIVPTPVIQHIKSMLEKINAQAGQPNTAQFSPGDEVLVAGGPFRGYQGIFDTQISGSERVKVLLKLISERQMPVEIDADQIIKKKDH